jgi:hypothetical protein
MYPFGRNAMPMHLASDYIHPHEDAGGNPARCRVRIYSPTTYAMRHPAPSGIYPGITHLGDARACSPQHTSAIVTG